MSDNQKKSGSGGARDISDLKARLGLKKGAAGAAVPPPTGGAVPAPVPAPAGVPGVDGDAHGAAAAEAAAAAEPSHDFSRDPFGGGGGGVAAPPGYYGYAPIPGVDDGKPAEQLNKPQPWGRLALMAGVVLVLFVAGFAMGKIQWARENMNKTIDDVPKLQAEVKRMEAVLAKVNDRIVESKEAAQGSPDVQLAVDLGSLVPPPPKSEAETEATYKNLFHTNYYYMADNLSIDRLFNYYNDTVLLYNLIAIHAKKSESDKEAIENFLKSAKAGTEKNYGFTVDVSTPVPKGHLAEVNGISCPKEGETNCAPDVMKLKFRTEPSGSWFERPVKGKLEQVIVPLEKSPLSTGAMAGNPDIVAAKDALRRQRDIAGIVGKLLGEQKQLLQKLDAEAARPKVNPYFIF